MTGCRSLMQQDRNTPWSPTSVTRPATPAAISARRVKAEEGPDTTLRPVRAAGQDTEGRTTLRTGSGRIPTCRSRTPSGDPGACTDASRAERTRPWPGGDRGRSLGRPLDDAVAVLGDVQRLVPGDDG